MKKTVSMILALVLCLLLCACGGEANEPQASTTQAPTSANVTVYKLGDVIETPLFKITPSFTGFAKELANWPDENYMTPAGKFSGDSPYSAAEGKSAMYGQIKIEYIGSEKSDVKLTLGISVDYDNGYVFEGYDVRCGYCETLDGDWTYENYMTFEPLSSSTTRILRYCVQVPEQVETNADKALLTTFSVNEEKFVYDFRSAEALGSDYDPRAEFYQPIDEATKTSIVSWLKKNGLKEMGWYADPVKTVGYYTFKFTDSGVTARLPINDSYAYDFKGTYEVYSGSILITWDIGKQMHLDYSFDGTTLDVISFEHDR